MRRALVAVVMLFAGCNLVFDLEREPEVPIPCPPAASAFVQVSSTTATQKSETVTATYLKPQQAGGLDVVIVGYTSASTVLGVSDLANNSYRLAAPETSSGTYTQTIYYAEGVSAADAGANTVTVMFSNAAEDVDLRIVEYSGLACTGSFDATSSASGTSQAMHSGPVTTSHDHDLLVAGTTVGGESLRAGDGYAQRIITSAYGNLVEDLWVDAAGTYEATAPQDSNHDWVMQVVAFRGQ